MDDFERELSRMLRDSEQYTPSSPGTGNGCVTAYGPAAAPAPPGGPAGRPSRWPASPSDWPCCRGPSP